MNVIQKTLGTVFPPYRFAILRKAQDKLLKAIISALPDEFDAIRRQTLAGRLYTLDDWTLFPDFKFVSMGYGGDSVFKYKKHGQNFKITGLQIFSKSNNKFETIEILIQDNLIRGLKIENSTYQLKEYDIKKIQVQNVAKIDFSFPKSGIDRFYEKLSSEIKQRLNPNDLSEIDFNNRIYYTFYDLEDGNYLAVDRQLIVYSLIHNAQPMVKRLKNSFIEILRELESGHFDKKKHFEERYKN